MKKLYSLCIALLTLGIANAQIDRSQQPQPGPAPKIQLGTPQTFTLKNGLTVLVVENHKLPRASANLSIDNPPQFEGEKAGVNALLSSMLGKGSTKTTKDDFNEEIDYLGARVSFGSSSAFASSLSRYFPRVLELMAEAVLLPNFTAEEFDKEKNILLEGIKSDENSVSAAARRVERLVTYGKNHPYGEYVKAETAERVTLSDVKNYYNTNFSPANAYLVIVGDVDFATIKKQVTSLFKSWKGKAPIADVFPKAKNASQFEVNFVDMPNAVQSEVSVDFTNNVKITDADYFPMLLANRILGGGAQARLFLNLREDKGYTYGSYSSFGTDKYARARMRAYASVRNAVTDSSAVELLSELNKLRDEAVSEEELNNAKAKYVGDFVLALEQPATIARYALNILTENLPEDFYSTYLEKINAVTIEDIQSVAQKHIPSNKVRLFVTGKAQEVLTNLEKTMPEGTVFHFYDKYGNPVERPETEVKLADGVTAASILESYLTAIGGREKAAAIRSKVEKAEASMQGMTLSIVSKKTNQQQSYLEVQMMGNTMQKQVVNKDKGYNEAQGQRMEMQGAELEEALKSTAIFEELTLDPATLTVKGIEEVNGEKAYVVMVNEKTTYFYAVESHLKIKESQTQEMQGQTITQESFLGDYKAVDGIMFPHKLTQSFGPQKIDFLSKSIELNAALSDADFQ